MARLPTWLAPLLIAIVVVAVLLMLSYCVGGKGEKNRQLEREAEVQRDVGDANTNASAARVTDVVRTAAEERELDAAIEAIGSPDERRALRGCVILRQQGRDTSAIAACRGPEGRPRAALP